MTLRCAQLSEWSYHQGLLLLHSSTIDTAASPTNTALTMVPVFSASHFELVAGAGGLSAAFVKLV